MIGTSWVFPMDLVKTHLQAQAKEGIKVSLRDTIAGIHAYERCACLSLMAVGR